MGVCSRRLESCQMDQFIDKCLYMLNEVETKIVHSLLLKNILPHKGIFQIKENHLVNFVSEYDLYFGKKGKGLRKKEYKFARKLAGLTLLKVNYNRGAKFKDMKSGIVYLIENPAFPEHYKLGMTIELNNRLNSYQTYDPYRSFKVTKYQFVLDRFKMESDILNSVDINKEQGEWIKKENALEVFNKMCIIPEWRSGSADDR